MEIFFQDPNEIPLPPSEVRIRQLRAEPWPEGRKVRIYLELDPFQKRPNVEVTISDDQANPVAQASIIETMTRKLEFNMHLRHPNTAGWYSVRALLYYQKEVVEPPPGEPVVFPDPLLVDEKEIFFEIRDS